MKMKLGIISGMGSRAGANFLQKIVEYSPAVKDQDFIEIILHNNSAIPDRTKAIVFNECSPVDEIKRSLKLFNENNVDVVVLSCITSYHYLEEIRKYTKGKIINPVGAVASYIIKKYPRIKRAGLLATTGTIKARLFHDMLNRHDITTITLEEEDQKNLFMKSLYMDHGLKSSFISEESKNLFFDAIRKLEEKGIEVLIGGCSEVSFMLHTRDIKMPYIDAIDVLARETVVACYNSEMCFSPVPAVSGLSG
jgi:aspartate racemase